jgi:zinc protease
MRNLVLKPDSFAQEIRVVMEERRLRTDDRPESLARERFMSMAYLTSPSRQPTVGWMQDLQAMTVEDLKRWYDMWYTPSNATLVVAGDVDPATVKALADRYFAPIPTHDVPKVPPARELETPGDRRMTLHAAVKVPVLYLAYNVPSLHTAKPGEAEAIRMMVGVLDEGMSARLETRLVREQRVAAAVSSGYDAFDRGDTLFMISAIPAAGRTLDELEKALLAEIEKLKTDAISADDLQRIYAGYLSGEVFQRDSVQSQASSIGALVSSGYRWQEQEEWPERLKKVTVDQVHQAAQTYLTPSRRSLLQLLPEEVKP